jgi:hypothetical protein
VPSPARHASRRLSLAIGPWRATAYIDVPHGAVRIGDALQLRAIFLRKMPTTEVDQFVVIAVVTDRGSEQGRGRMVAVLQGSEGARRASPRCE